MTAPLAAWPWLRPGQAPLYVESGFLARARRVSARLGDVALYLYNEDSGWRSYARQEWLYLYGPNIASPPDRGPRMHMRGGAADFVRQDAAFRKAARAEGLIPDPIEGWHWNDPRLTTMPIIPTLAAGGIGGTATLHTERKAPTMLLWRIHDAGGNLVEFLLVNTAKGTAKSTGRQATANLWHEAIGTVTPILDTVERDRLIADFDLTRI